MKFSASVVINSYNYGGFVLEAIRSALAQTVAPMEVIVVDDGSTDDTCAAVAHEFGANAKVRLISQRNAGQLAAFVAGFEAAGGDVIFLLDADDRYGERHIDEVLTCLAQHPEVDFVFTGHRQFGHSTQVCQLAPHDRHLGVSAIRTLFRGAWIGSVTSTLALRRPLVHTLLPVLRPLVPRWRIRADDCLVVGASLAGAQKYFLAPPSVEYRTHEANNFHGRRRNSEAADYSHWIRRDSLVAVMARELGVRPDIGIRADVEFRTVATPTRADYADYVALVRRLRISPLKRLKMRVNLRRHFRQQADAIPVALKLAS